MFLHVLIMFWFQVAHAFADILFAEVKDESFNGDY